jgi:hypothetical protein
MTEEEVWMVWDLDEEYAKFTAERDLLEGFLKRASELDPSVSTYLTELSYTKTQRDLRNFEVSLAPF